MPARKQVLKSINSEDGARCVDVFRRPDGTVGFEEYRRDAEDLRGWFPIGGYHAESFASADEALAMARTRMPWLDSVLELPRGTPCRSTSVLTNGARPHGHRT